MSRRLRAGAGAGADTGWNAVCRTLDVASALQSTGGHSAHRRHCVRRRQHGHLCGPCPRGLSAVAPAPGSRSRLARRCVSDARADRLDRAPRARPPARPARGHSATHLDRAARPLPVLPLPLRDRLRAAGPAPAAVRRGDDDRALDRDVRAAALPGHRRGAAVVVHGVRRPLPHPLVAALGRRHRSSLAGGSRPAGRRERPHAPAGVRGCVADGCDHRLGLPERQRFGRRGPDGSPRLRLGALLPARDRAAGHRSRPLAHARAAAPAGGDPRSDDAGDDAGRGGRARAWGRSLRWSAPGPPRSSMRTASCSPRAASTTRRAPGWPPAGGPGCRTARRC